jgi:hypothetical protein
VRRTVRDRSNGAVPVRKPVVLHPPILLFRAKFPGIGRPKDKMLFSADWFFFSLAG